jgi:small subunit ribosomal protein S2
LGKVEPSGKLEPWGKVEPPKPHTQARQVRVDGFRSKLAPDERGRMSEVLAHLQAAADEAHAYASELGRRGGTILFIGTKKQAQEVVSEHATRVGMPYVNNRWLGGMLTNFATISKRLGRLRELREMERSGATSYLPKKEVIRLRREEDKLERNLGGLQDLERLPDAVFVVDTKKEHIAVNEARKLGLPVIAIVDTNCDPDEVDYVIPGNDDAIRSLKLFAGKIAEACILGQKVGRERANQQRSARDEGGGEEPQTIRVSSGGEGPRVEVVSRRRSDLPAPEAAATPDDEAGKN